MVVEYFPCNVEQVEQLWVPYRIVDVLTVFSGCEDVAIPENSQLLREIALLHIQARTQIIYAYFALAEFIQDSDAERMRKGLEEFRFELAEFAHEYSYILILWVWDKAESRWLVENAGRYALFLQFHLRWKTNELRVPPGNPLSEF